MKSKRAREAATAVEEFLPVDDAPVEKKRKRGDDEPTEVKQKKAKKSKKDKKESRKEKKDKRKNLQDLPGEEEEEQAEQEQDAADTDTKESQAPDMSDEKQDKKPKKEKQKKEKKEKKEKKRTEEANGDDSNKHKKEKDKKKKCKDETSSTQEAAPPTSSEAQAAKPSRYIVFVGNLPFTATADSIKAHFASLKPTSVRCLKNKDDDKPCRGIAFVEFANVWTMRTCLDKFHHTEFEGRKINVELTAGGGGKTTFRKDKIREKNKKLDENRSKRIDKERAAKEESGGKSQENMGAIHPSRLARNPRLAE